MENAAAEMREAFKVLAEAWHKFRVAMANVIKRLIDHIKGMARDFADWINEIHEEPLQRYDLEHQKLIMFEHQKAAAQVIRSQERKMRDRKPHWRAWKAQRL